MEDVIPCKFERKWQTSNDKGEHLTIQIGDVVVMEEGNMPRSSWRLGKVEG